MDGDWKQRREKMVSKTACGGIPGDQVTDWCWVSQGKKRNLLAKEGASACVFPGPTSKIEKQKATFLR